ncbi:hypothetical protein RJT34_06157 [Clitoria ternatea]|uniref:KIB1-4 beta-propeller domain-containing protein n=1 Tax=Clitoria ternatea TaxID=43366 RepID=A0AAN9K401_CLITE
MLGSELPADLLNEIVKYIHSLRDYVRIGAVCKTWNLALPKTIPNHITTPLRLVLPSQERIHQFSIVPHLRMPELHNCFIAGSSFGWLFCVGIDRTLLVVNPLTKSRFNLPPIPTFSPVAYGRNIIEKPFICMQRNFVTKIIFTCSPDHSKEFMAVANQRSRLAFCRSGDDTWTDIKHRGTWCKYEDIIYHDGKVYAIDDRYRLHEFDMKTARGGWSGVSMPRGDGHSYNYAKYLAFNPEGDLLLLVRHFEFYLEPVYKSYKTCRVDVYKRNANKWMRECSLGNNVLVIGYNSPIWMSHILDNKGNQLRNCICFSDNMVEFHYRDRVGGHDVGIYNLEDGTVTQIFPNSDFIWPPPVWLSQS